jgi:hypothetical protein
MSGKKVSDLRKARELRFKQNLQSCRETGIPELVDLALSCAALLDCTVGRLKHEKILCALESVMAACNARTCPP